MARPPRGRYRETTSDEGQAHEVRRLVLVMVAIVLVLPACGDGGHTVGTTPAAAAGPPAGATLEGVVRRDGAPVAGGRVVLSAPGAPERSAPTGPDGAYRLAGVTPGSYELVASSDSGVSCSAAGCISAVWAERSDLVVAGDGLLRHDVDGD